MCEAWEALRQAARTDCLAIAVPNEDGVMVTVYDVPACSPLRSATTPMMYRAAVLVHLARMAHEEEGC